MQYFDVVTERDAGSWNIGDAVTLYRVQLSNKFCLIWEYRKTIFRYVIESKEFRIQKTWWASRWNDGTGVQSLDIAHGSRKLALNFQINEFAHSLSRLVVNHRIPNST